jgi:hypothetical protein
MWNHIFFKYQLQKKSATKKIVRHTILTKEDEISMNKKCKIRNIVTKEDEINVIQNVKNFPQTESMINCLKPTNSKKRKRKKLRIRSNYIKRPCYYCYHVRNAQNQ